MSNELGLTRPIVRHFTIVDPVFVSSSRFDTTGGGQVVSTVPAGQYHRGPLFRAAAPVMDLPPYHLMRDPSLSPADPNALETGGRRRRRR